MTATTGRLRISPLGKRRQALVRRWLDRAAEEMYAAPGVDKGLTAEETAVVRLTIDMLTDQFTPTPAPAQGAGPLAECPDKPDVGHVWECGRRSDTCVRCVPMKYKGTMTLDGNPVALKKTRSRT